MKNLTAEHAEIAGRGQTSGSIRLYFLGVLRALGR